MNYYQSKIPTIYIFYSKKKKTKKNTQNSQFFFQMSTKNPSASPFFRGGVVQNAVTHDIQLKSDIFCVKQ